MSKDQKRESIIDAAQKRFNHFGVAKTTMNEIADDLAISKASLYYYFPDKLNLYAAVLQKIISAEEGNLEKYIKHADPLNGLLSYLDTRTNFIVQHYNILEYLRTMGANVPEEVEPVFNAAKSREKITIAAIIHHAIKQGKLQLKDPDKTAALLHDCLDGLRLSVITSRRNFFPDKSQFFELAEREKELTTIFFKGISHL